MFQVIEIREKTTTHGTEESARSSFEWHKNQPAPYDEQFTVQLVKDGLVVDQFAVPNRALEGPNE